MCAKCATSANSHLCHLIIISIQIETGEVDHLLSMWKALDLIPCTAKKKKRKQNTTMR
jgi:hypothetical protein